MLTPLPMRHCAESYIGSGTNKPNTFASAMLALHVVMSALFGNVGRVNYSGVNTVLL